MMNMIYRRIPEGETLFGQVMDLYAKNEPAAVAIVNRAQFMKEQILNTIKEHGGSRVGICSLGSGPAREMIELLKTNPEIASKLDVVMIDQDQKALTFVENELRPFTEATNAKFTMVQESVENYRDVKRLASLIGSRHLTYSVGLFDYFNDHTFKSILSGLYDGIGSGGKLIIGNQATHNPSRPMLEYITDWFVFYRTRQDLSALAESLHPKPASFYVDAEKAGINLFLIVRK